MAAIQDAAEFFVSHTHGLLYDVSENTSIMFVHISIICLLKESASCTEIILMYHDRS